jgi:predicted HicB family RNase H-like nuclease
MKNMELMPSGGQREGAGRHPKGDKAFPAQYIFRCDHAERAAWEKAAKKDGKPLSDWVRDTLNQAAK